MGLNTCPEKAMAPHSSTLAWKIPWTKEPGEPSNKFIRGYGKQQNTADKVQSCW